MCEPTTIALVTLSAASALTSVQAQKQQASLARHSQASAIQSAKIKNDAINTRILQEREAAANEIQKNQKRAAKARSTALTAAGEAGVAGRSVDQLMRDLFFQEGAFSQAVRTNLGFAEQQAELNKRGVTASTQGTINQIHVPEPNFAQAALRVGSAVAGAYWSAPAMSARKSANSSTALSSQPLYNPSQINNYGY